MRSCNGYPQQLARAAGLSLIDMTCSGATARHVLNGGQYFQGPQIDAVGPDTKLVTLTAGGNDVGYVGDLTLLAYKRRGGFPGALIRHLWKGPRTEERRNFDQLRRNLRAILIEAARRAPSARIVVVTYPSIVPPVGCCPALGIDEAEARLMAAVAEELAAVTRSAAEEAGATVVDMAVSSVGHDACAPEPWIHGFSPKVGTAFHPTLAGAIATAQQIQIALER
jgi:lysophospholipase L1-like esterase